MTRKGSFDEERFWSLVTKGEHWMWTGRKSSNGYGMWGGGYAHRIAYEKLKGPIPFGLTLDHLCRIRSCVNPDHLEAVTMRENIMRGTAPTVANAGKTACDHGHAFTPENTITRRDRPGTRECRECNRIRGRLAARAKYRKEHPNAKIRKG